MKHFLLTRFNLRNPHWKKLKNGEAVLTDAWLKHRFELFETYCFPSVVNQKNKAFIWCICFDTHTPETYKNRIEALVKNHSNFFVLYIDGFDKMTKSLNIFIKDKLTKNDRFIITTRLDNDDIIHHSFLKTIQDHANFKNKTLIDLVDGYQLVLRPNGNIIRHYRYKLNPFISLIEAVDNFETILSKEHHDWGKENTIVHVKKQLLWIQLIHNKNYFNTSLTANKLTANFNPLDFGLSPDLKTQGKIKTTFLNVFQLPLRMLLRVRNSWKRK
ncbi:MAG: hypothetical protein GYB39_01340 [Algicola sp.]|nr:hypothetical protein [Algicola sp.]